MARDAKSALWTNDNYSSPSLRVRDSISDVAHAAGRPLFSMRQLQRFFSLIHLFAVRTVTPPMDS